MTICLLMAQNARTDQKEMFHHILQKPTTKQYAAFVSHYWSLPFFACFHYVARPMKAMGLNGM